jgi:MFS family permease
MSIGSMLAIPVVPYVADILGRRAGVVLGCVIMLFGVAMVSIGYRVALFVVGRIILGFGLGIAQVTSTGPLTKACSADCLSRNALLFW